MAKIACSDGLESIRMAMDRLRRSGRLSDASGTAVMSHITTEIKVTQWGKILNSAVFILIERLQEDPLFMYSILSLVSVRMTLAGLLPPECYFVLAALET